MVLGVLHPDRVGGLVDSEGEPGPLLVRGDPLGDVLDHRDEGGRSLAGQEVNPHLDRVHGPVLAAMGRLECDLVARTAPERCEDLRERGLRQLNLEVEGRPLAELVERVAQVPQGAGVRPGEAQGLGVEDVDLAAQLIEQPGQPCLLRLELEAFRDVLGGADQPDRVTRPVANRLAFDVHQALCAVGPGDAVRHRVRSRTLARATVRRLLARDVVRVDQREQRGIRPAERSRLDAEDPAELVGPLDRIRGEVPLPAPDMGDPLSLGQAALAFAQTPLGRGTLPEGRNPEREVVGKAGEQVDVLRAECIRGGSVDGERAERTRVRLQGQGDRGGEAAPDRLLPPWGELGIDEEAPADRGSAGADRRPDRAPAQRRVGPRGGDRPKVAGLEASLGDRVDGPFRIVPGEPDPREPVTGLVDRDPADHVEQLGLALGAEQRALRRAEDHEGTLVVNPVTICARSRLTRRKHAPPGRTRAPPNVPLVPVATGSDPGATHPTPHATRLSISS